MSVSVTAFVPNSHLGSAASGAPARHAALWVGVCWFAPLGEDTAQLHTFQLEMLHKH